MADSLGSAPSPPGSADPVRWTRARDLFHAALQLAPEDRAAFLESACGNDQRLRAEVSSLLASDEQAGAFIEQPASTLLADSAARPFAPRIAPGAVVGRFEILEFLGAGGTNEVYRARDSRLGRTVALKFVTDPADREAGSRLLAEAQHVSILNHPNICGVHEAENDDELPFIVLELVEGPTLSDLLNERRPSTREVVQWAKEIAAALDHAHRRGVIHRDLKSANVAVSPDGGVKVLDFGLSRRLTGTDWLAQSPAAILTNASVAGTLTHIAPEVLKGAPLDHRVDLWAFGVMLYQMTTGLLPFKRATAFETANAILEEAPDPLPATVPSDLRRLIERCLAKDPALRLATAAELREALDAVRFERLASGRRLGRQPMLVAIALAIAIAGWFGWWQTSGTVTAPPVLAVLPFDNSSGDASQTFFADGLTEELIAALGRIDGVRVIAAGTSMRYRNAARPMRDMARADGADRLLEGAVARVAGEIRLSARVVEASTGRVVWSENYRRDAQEVLALQATIARAVARSVQVELSAEDARHFAAVRAVAPDVYEAYLKGRFYWNQRTADSLRTAVRHFETAIALDPTYAPAYASLADCYNLLGTVLVAGGSPTEWRPKAMEAAIKALQIDAELGEAHATLGYVRHYDWQWTEAENSFRRAIALNPNYALGRIWYANLLCSLRRFDEAVAEVLMARDLDPLSLIVSTNVGWVFHRARRNEEAIAEYTRGLSLDSTYLQAHMRLTDSYLAVGRLNDAVDESETVARLSNRRPADVMLLERTKLLAGRPNEFERRLGDLIASSAKGYASPAAIATAYFAVGRKDEGFVWLERAYRERTNNIVYLAVEPVYDGVRDDPRFQAILRGIGLP
ncbi:MAG: protein kinase [Vicinamibacterales bacterium]